MGALLTEHDTTLAQSFVLNFPLKGNLEFQFPPKITSDGRSGTWNEKPGMGTEPIAVFGTSGPREITLGATYIVDGSSGWNINRIHDQIRKARGYYAQIRKDGSTRNLVLHLKMWGIGGNEPVSARLTNIGVKYGDAIVGTGDDAFPLRTDLTLDIRIWTMGAPSDAVQYVKELDKSEVEPWY